MNVTHEIPARLPALVRHLIELGDIERSVIDELVVAVKAGERLKAAKLAETLARSREVVAPQPEIVKRG